MALRHAATLLRAVIVGKDGDHAVVQAEYRHEYKAVQLEIQRRTPWRRFLCPWCTLMRMMFISHVMMEPIAIMMTDGKTDGVNAADQMLAWGRNLRHVPVGYPSSFCSLIMMARMHATIWPMTVAIAAPLVPISKPMGMLNRPMS